VRRCVALTFDDAYRGVLELALPLLERFAAPATVFVATAYAREGARYWWDRLAWVMERRIPASLPACSTPASISRLRHRTQCEPPWWRRAPAV